MKISTEYTWTKIKALLKKVPTKLRSMTLPDKVDTEQTPEKLRARL